MIRFIILFFLIHIPSTHHSIYNFYGDTPFQYKLVFTGEVILESEFFNVTNNGKFSLLYTVQNRSEFSTKDQNITDFYFSDLSVSNLTPILPILWKSYLQEKNKEIAYFIRLRQEQMTVFDKQAELHPLSYIMDIFFPIIRTNQPMYKQQISLPYKSKKYGNRLFSRTVQGWNFFKYDNTLIPTEPLILLDTNTQFINQIYKKYAANRHSKQDSIFWLQYFQSNTKNIYSQVQNYIDIIGIYIIDLNNTHLHSSYLTGKIYSKIPYKQKDYYTSLDLTMEGQFNIELLYPSIPDHPQVISNSKPN